MILPAPPREGNGLARVLDEDVDHRSSVTFPPEESTARGTGAVRGDKSVGVTVSRGGVRTSVAETSGSGFKIPRSGWDRSIELLVASPGRPASTARMMISV